MATFAASALIYCDSVPAVPLTIVVADARLGYPPFATSAGKKLAKLVRDVRSLAAAKTPDERRQLQAQMRSRDTMGKVLNRPLEATVPSEQLPARRRGGTQPGLPNLPGLTVAADLDRRRQEEERRQQELQEQLLMSESSALGRAGAPAAASR